MKLLYTHENPICVQNAKNLAENAGFQVILKNQYSGSGIGELAPIETWMELWLVQDDDFEKAQALVAQLQTDSVLEAWICKKCGEKNEGNFQSCWQCQAPAESA